MSAADLRPAMTLSAISRRLAGSSFFRRPLHDVQRVLQRTRQTVELPDDDRVTLAQMVEEAVQLWAVPAPAGGCLLEQASATGGPERLCL